MWKVFIYGQWFTHCNVNTLDRMIEDYAQDNNLRMLSYVAIREF